jgi:hypothetical protein
MSVVSSDYQHFIPLYVAAIRTWSKDDIRIYLNDELKKFAKPTEISGAVIVENIFKDYPQLPSTFNSMRFVYSDENLMKLYAYVMITDIDMLILQDQFQWFTDQFKDGNCIAGYHGAWKKPHRPNICSRWKGNFERMAGAVVCVTPKWYYRTKGIRSFYDWKLKNGREGTYRENDEVILARMMKEIGLKLPTSKNFPSDVRGVHLGDFRDNMTKRWTNSPKMARLLSTKNCRLYQEFKQTKQFKDIVNVLNNADLNKTLLNLDAYLMTRGL